MPILGNLDDNMEYLPVHTGTFQFSAVRPDELGATEYTLVTIVVDTTGSVSSFENELRGALIEAIKACNKSPRAENLLVRVISFNSKNNINEVHGFKLLNSINVNDDYPPFYCGGMTALYDAAYESILTTMAYAKRLADQDFDVNGIIFVITDGEDNDSIVTSKYIKDELSNLIRDEYMESLLTILVGVNDSQCRTVLETFKNDANFSQFVSVGNFNKDKAAKLAAFVSKSVSSQSQSLGTGGPSQTLTF